jgi:hypothetical protein
MFQQAKSTAQYAYLNISNNNHKEDNMNGTVRAICICPTAGGPMQQVVEVEAMAGQGLKGDRYTTGEGSFNKGKTGVRQVTLMNTIFFEGSGFEFKDSCRNLFVEGVELMWLIGREFQIGTARFRSRSEILRPMHQTEQTLRQIEKF